MKTITRAKVGILSHRQLEALVLAFSTCENVVLVEDTVIADAIKADGIRADAAPGSSDHSDADEVFKAVEDLCQAHNLIVDVAPIHNASDPSRNRYFQIRRR